MSHRRLQSIDVLRGAVMVLMALDHARIYLATHDCEALDLEHTTAGLFLTRWVTHFCAPVFVLLAGAGARLSALRGTSRRALSRFLWSRGLWLMLLELTLVRVAWRFDLELWHVFLLILWGIGLSMVVLAALVHLPTRAVVGIGMVLVVGHHALSPLQPEDPRDWYRLWMVLHGSSWFEIGPVTVRVSYPLIPWVGVMALGYGLGAILNRPAAERRRALVRIGAAACAGFLLLRMVNGYGDWRHWSPQPSALWTALSFANCEKYPPSLLFLLMTLGPALLVLAALDRAGAGETPVWLRPLLVLGRVPLFFYVLHLYLIHAMALGLVWVRYGRGESLFHPGPEGAGTLIDAPPGYGFPLWVVYLVWAAAVLLLLPLCHWFGSVKRGRTGRWLRYL